MILYSDMSNLAIGAAVTAVGVVAAPVALGAIGFGAAGIVAGSLAASVQGPAVVAGGLFATLQAFAADGGFTVMGGTTAVAAGAATWAAVGEAARLVIPAVYKGCGY